jgi:hypothetical protein
LAERGPAASWEQIQFLLGHLLVRKRHDHLGLETFAGDACSGFVLSLEAAKA